MTKSIKPIWVLAILLAVALSVCSCQQPIAEKKLLSSKENMTTAQSDVVMQQTTAVSSESLTTADLSSMKNGELANVYLRTLDQMGPRMAGTEQEVKAADWLVSELGAMDYQVTRMPFDYQDKGDRRSENIAVQKKGTGEGVIIVGAHYDSVDAGKGVDDNGSGVAVALEVAKRIKAIETPYTIEFVFFGAEEVDIIGSAAYVNQMTPEQIKNTVLMINFDSLVAGDLAYVYGNADEMGKARERVLEIAKNANLDLITQEGMNPEFPRGVTGPWSDHSPFETIGLPYIYFESTNWNLGKKDGYTQVNLELGENGEVWHTQYDTYEYIEKTFPGRIQERLTLFTTILQLVLTEANLTSVASCH